MPRSDDIANLFHSIGVSPSSYREISNLLGTAQALPSPATGTPPPALVSLLNDTTTAPPQRAVPAQVVVVVSGKGGVGKSTVTAALATVLNRGERTYAIDLDPQNAVMRNLALDADRPGLVQLHEGSAAWQEIVQKNHPRGFCVPYGAATTAQQQQFEQTLRDDPEWLARQLAHLHTRPRDTLVIDTPAGSSVYLDQALAIADLVLMVTLPDAASYHALERMEQVLKGRVPLHYVINQVDATREFSQSMVAVISKRLTRNLLGVIHQDHFLSESVAYERNPLNSSPASTGCLDLLDLARSLQHALTQPQITQPSTS